MSLLTFSHARRLATSKLLVTLLVLILGLGFAAPSPSYATDCPDGNCSPYPEPCAASTDSTQSCSEPDPTPTPLPSPDCYEETEWITTTDSETNLAIEGAEPEPITTQICPRGTMGLEQPSSRTQSSPDGVIFDPFFLCDYNQRATAWWSTWAPGFGSWQFGFTYIYRGETRAGAFGRFTSCPFISGCDWRSSAPRKSNRAYATFSADFLSGPILYWGGVCH